MPSCHRPDLQPTPPTSCAEIAKSPFKPLPYPRNTRHARIQDFQWLPGCPEAFPVSGLVEALSNLRHRGNRVVVVVILDPSPRRRAQASNPPPQGRNGAEHGSPLTVILEMGQSKDKAARFRLAARRSRLVRGRWKLDPVGATLKRAAAGWAGGALIVNSARPSTPPAHPAPGRAGGCRPRRGASGRGSGTL